LFEIPPRCLFDVFHKFLHLSTSLQKILKEIRAIHIFIFKSKILAYSRKRALKNIFINFRSTLNSLRNQFKSSGLFSSSLLGQQPFAKEKKKKERLETSRILISRKLPGWSVESASARVARRDFQFFSPPFCPSPRARTAGKSTAARRAVYCGTRRIRIARIKSREYRRARGVHSREHL